MRFLPTLFGLVLWSAAAAASTPDLLRVAKNSDGSPALKNYESAMEFCRGQGKRIPTAREFARFAQTLGARGTRETKLPDVPLRDKLVYQEMNSFNRTGQYKALFRFSEKSNSIVIHFYFSKEGYSNPNVEEYRVWTSTPFPSGSEDFAQYYFEAKNGGLTEAIDRAELLSVTCVR